MQRTIIATLELFVFDKNNLQKQFDFEKNQLADLLRTKYPLEFAGAKYRQIVNNIACYFQQNYGFELQK